MLQVLGPVAGFGIEQDETGVYLVLRLRGDIGDNGRGVACSIEGRGQVVAHQAGVATFARLRPAHSLRIAQRAVPATYHNPDCVNRALVRVALDPAQGVALAQPARSSGRGADGQTQCLAASGRAQFATPFGLAICERHGTAQPKAPAKQGFPSGVRGIIDV